jgi:hypothetical protein
MTLPTVQFLQFDKSINPSGYRHIPASGVRSLDTSITGFLDFGSVNTTTSGRISDTKMVVFRVSDFGDASGIFNMRFFLSNTNAFNTGTYRFLQRVSTHWLGSNFNLTLADVDTPRTTPSQNVLSTSGQPVLSGLFDGHVSQYIYLATYVGTDVPYGTYGGPAANTFRYRMLYDFS